MAKEAGTGGLSTGGWAVVAGGALSAGLLALYALGVIGSREAEEAVLAVPAPAQDAEAAKTVETKPEPVEVAKPEPKQEPQTEAGTETSVDQGQAKSETEAAPAAEQAAAPSVEPEEKSVALAAPVLDQIFVEQDGTLLLSGTAEAGSRISVLLDGAEMHGFDVVGDGKFAEFLTLSFSDAARVLALRADRDGQTTMSDDYIIAALPAPEPVQVAEAAKEAAEPDTNPAAVETAEAQTTDAPKPSDAQPPVVTGDAAVQPSVDVPGEASSAETQEQVADAAQQAQPEPTAQASQTETAAVATPPAPTASEPGEAAAESTKAPQTQQAEATAPVQQDVATAEEATPATDAPAAMTAQSEQAATTVTATAEQPGAGQAVAAQTAPVAVLRSDASGVELVQAPEVKSSLEPVRVALDTIGYSETGSVRLTGRANGGSVVRVYFNNRAVSDVSTDDKGKWRGEIDGVEPGVYTLRLDELGQGGTVLSRLETPFKREAPEILRPADPQSGEAPARPLVHAVTVQKGDTLWAISRERYGEGLLYVKVFDANRSSIRNPDLIYPGQIFTLPD
ncbi:LysM peptidoglycan-binding domain-containing protein [Ruegeria sp. WL0004]|uniref:LysM peptidoglycan-binding domain-containing protein n=1 Tax=Ruegeria marisflavi TaxID=2984152 RepID=A0ABT2WQ57_9RHOB|nr:LysM peptidoglycan-binding domain-containing protein [Ruegeria sp. WL0004]MCU9838019.1 LysM peptidoglycan-binding domain-containing protein [Ruegeria sp. WL0004]